MPCQKELNEINRMDYNSLLREQKFLHLEIQGDLTPERRMQKVNRLILVNTYLAIRQPIPQKLAPGTFDPRD